MPDKVLRAELKAMVTRTSETQKEIIRTYMYRMEQMGEVLIRWIGYHTLSMEDYKSFHPDADPENELENLVKMSEDLAKLKYEEMSSYIGGLVGFFNSIRSKMNRVQKGDKIEIELKMTSEDILKLDEKMTKIDELRKKLP